MGSAAAGHHPHAGIFPGSAPPYPHATGETLMRVIGNRLHTATGAPVPFRESPNRGGVLVPEYLVIHYTAEPTAERAIAHLLDPRSRVSAHLVIARDGALTQLVRFNRVAWHAGVSRWEGRGGLNRFSIGVELANAGRLERRQGRWRAWFGGAIPDHEVLVASHRHESATAGWHVYPEAQLAALFKAAEALARRYDIRAVLGHDDVAPGRKQDPGPAFPMQRLREHLFGPPTA